MFRVTVEPDDGRPRLTVLATTGPDGKTGIQSVGIEAVDGAVLPTDAVTALDIPALVAAFQLALGGLPTTVADFSPHELASKRPRGRPRKGHRADPP